MRTSLWVGQIALLGGLLALSGCGGGSTPGTANSTGRGAVRFRVQWPATRAALTLNSLRVTLSNAGQPVAEQLLARPAAGNSSTVTFEGLPTGPLTLTTRAFTSRDASGTPVASSSTEVPVADGQTTDSTVSTSTPVVSVKIRPVGATLEAGNTVVFTASAYDEANQPVLVPAAQWKWTSTDTAALTVAADGEKVTVTGVAAGYANLVIEETTSNTRDQVTVTILTRAPYTVTDLGLLNDGGEFVALGLNESGAIVGKFTGKYGRPGGFLWKDGAMRAVVTVTGGDKNSADYGHPNAINSAGEVAGWIVRGSYEEQQARALLPARFNALFGIVTGINDSEQAVGVLGSPSVFEPTRAVLWSAGQPPQFLPALNDSLYSRANGLNDSGLIVGESESGVVTDAVTQKPRRNSDVHAVVWQNGQVSDLGPGVAVAVNKQGQVVGTERRGSDTGNDITYHAFLWQNGQKTELGPGTANGLNNKGQIVGTNAETALLWENGQLVDLNTKIYALSGWRLKTATAINDKGQIVGAGFTQGGLRAFLLTPRP